MNGVLTRHAIPEDRAAIYEVHRSSILGSCSAHYTAEQLQGWTAVLSPDAYLKLFGSKEFLVAEEQGRIIGFAVLDVEKRLVNAVYVDPGHVRKGVGRRLAESLEELARARNVTELWLNSTLNAVPFYETLGYCRGKDSVTRLSNGTELPCVLMSKGLE